MFEIGDKIQCWTSHECTRKMMELASKGYQCREYPPNSNKLEITGIPEEKDDKK